MNTTPLYAKFAAIAGRPLVLLASLVMSAPAEIELAQAAGFRDGFEYLSPLVLSLYAVCAAVIAATRDKTGKGRVSAIVGSAVALTFAMSSQVVAHLISSGYMVSGPWLVAAVSSVPALSAAHMLHLATLPKSPVSVTNEDSGQEDETEPVNGSEDTEAPSPLLRPDKGSKGRPKPSLALIRDAAMNLDATGQKVTASALAKVFGVSERTGARYLSQLTA
ncbi:hypothetical protein [Streptomyces sp. DSM 118148]|uniref:hypothetical protein n=1 Tax=Streptomyces sp. DSM 118148 TaxID=3448667 RepID=UPI00403FEA07